MLKHAVFLLKHVALLLKYVVLLFEHHVVQCSGMLQNYQICCSVFQSFRSKYFPQAMTKAINRCLLFPFISSHLNAEWGCRHLWSTSGQPHTNEGFPKNLQLSRNRALVTRTFSNSQLISKNFNPLSLTHFWKAWFPI